MKKFIEKMIKLHTVNMKNLTLRTLALFLLTFGKPSYSEDYKQYDTNQEGVGLSNIKIEPKDPEAQFILGQNHDASGNRSLAMKWYLRAAEQGHIEAQFNLGDMYYKGDGVDQDIHGAIYWFNKAAEQGLSKAQFNLGIIYDKGADFEKNKTKAFKWFLKAAEQGIVKAQYNVGNMYFQGNGVSQDYPSAAIWFNKAAEQEHVIAAGYLGRMYYKGIGIPEDKEKGISFLKKAAKEGDELSIQILESIFICKIIPICQ